MVKLDLTSDCLEIQAYSYVIMNSMYVLYAVHKAWMPPSNQNMIEDKLRGSVCTGCLRCGSYMKTGKVNSMLTP